MGFQGRRGDDARGGRLKLSSGVTRLRKARAPIQNAPSHGSLRLGSSAMAILQGSAHTCLSRGARRDTCTAPFAMTFPEPRSRAADGTTLHLSHTDLVGVAIPE